MKIFVRSTPARLPFNIKKRAAPRAVPCIKNRKNARESDFTHFSDAYYGKSTNGRAMFFTPIERLLIALFNHTLLGGVSVMGEKLDPDEPCTLSENTRSSDVNFSKTPPLILTKKIAWKPYYITFRWCKICRF